MLDAAKAAEAVITTGQTPNSIPSGGTVDGGSGAGLEGEVEDDGLASPAPTAASMVDVNALTPQTFLVRPTRPDSNRNRGRNAFKPKPPKPKPSVPDVPPNPGATPMAKPKAEDLLDEEEDEFGEDIVEEMEFLQLGLEEAWFLSTGLGVLQVFDPTTVSPLGLQSTHCNSGNIHSAIRSHLHVHHPTYTYHFCLIYTPPTPRRPIPRLICRLLSFQIIRLGRQTRYQVLL